MNRPRGRLAADKTSSKISARRVFSGVRGFVAKAAMVRSYFSSRAAIPSKCVGRSAALSGDMKASVSSQSASTNDENIMRIHK